MSDTTLLVDSRVETPQIIRFASGTLGVISLRSPDKDTPNEDAAAIIPVSAGGGVVAVADGFGGRPSGEKAARAAVEALAAAVGAADRDNILARDAILNGFEDGNTAVMDLAVGAATTLLAADIVGTRLRTYNVGDSMLLVVGQRGKEKLRTLSHSPVGYAVESGMLDEDEAMHHEDRHYVSNMVGGPDMRIELTISLELSPLDTVVLGTDGLWDNLHADEVIDLVRTGPVEEVMAKLLDLCVKRMTDPKKDAPSKPDDCTFMVYRAAALD